MFEQLDYIREEGRFKWKTGGKGRSIDGYAGSNPSRSCRFINIDYKNYSEPRLVWFFEYGSFPNRRLFFLDRNPLNSRIENLSFYANPLESDKIKRCSKCKEYKNRHECFSMRGNKSEASCKECRINIFNQRLINRRKSTNIEDVEKIKKLNEYYRRKYKDRCEFDFFINQLESQQND